MRTYKSFADLARQDRAAEAADRKAAANLRRSASISNRKPGTGPRIAKAVR
jgi:hypothetical protein